MRLVNADDDHARLMQERVKFVLEWESRWEGGEGRLNFAELCREFGMSRQVRYGRVARSARRSTMCVQSRSARDGR